MPVQRIRAPLGGKSDLLPDLSDEDESWYYYVCGFLFMLHSLDLMLVSWILDADVMLYMVGTLRRVFARIG